MERGVPEREHPTIGGHQPVALARRRRSHAHDRPVQRNRPQRPGEARIVTRKATATARSRFSLRIARGRTWTSWCSSGRDAPHRGQRTSGPSRCGSVTPMASAPMIALRTARPGSAPPDRAHGGVLRDRGLAEEVDLVIAEVVAADPPAAAKPAQLGDGHAGSDAGTDTLVGVAEPAGATVVHDDRPVGTTARRRAWEQTYDGRQPRLRSVAIQGASVTTPKRTTAAPRLIRSASGAVSVGGVVEVRSEAWEGGSRIRGRAGGQAVRRERAASGDESAVASNAHEIEGDDDLRREPRTHRRRASVRRPVESALRQLSSSRTSASRSTA